MEDQQEAQPLVVVVDNKSLREYCHARPGSRIHDNCRVPLSGTQFPGLPPTDLQDITDNHCLFENLTYIRVYEYIN